MHILVISIVLSICGFLTSFLVVGIFPSIIAFCTSIYCFLQKKTISIARALFMSLAGILVPIIMYLNCYGISLPFDKGTGMSVLKQIIYDNYSNMGFDMSFFYSKDAESEVYVEETEVDENIDSPSDEAENEEDEDMYFVSDGVVQDTPGYKKEEAKDENSSDSSESAESIEGQEDSLDYRDYPKSIFEKFKDIEKDYETKPESKYVGASDDDMPSYGGLPLGTVIVAQYFREDDHNCNPVLVLQNRTGEIHRYECIFTARDANGDEIAVSEKTSEVVPDGAKFVIEGRFDKKELGGEIPSMYEFTVSKKVPYEKDMTDMVAVQAKVSGNSVIVAAENSSDIKVKVDSYVLFFDGNELVDCIWLIPSNVDEVCISPKSLASIKGDAYYKFDRIETYYTAYEAIETSE